MNDKNNGLITRIWGPYFWVSLFAVAFGYPIEPSSEQKKHYLEYFKTVQYVLPCKYCRNSYSHFIISEPTVLRDDVFESRNSLTKWVYELRNRVNQKLQVNYGTSYESVVEKYESIRAVCYNDTTNTNFSGCIMPADKKAPSYQNMEIRECPIISIRFSQAISEYARTRGVDFTKINSYNDLKKKFINLYKNSYDKDADKKNWSARNNECYKIIMNMRKSGIPSLEKDGEFVGLPTVDELKLISMLSTTLCRNELFEITKKLNKPVYCYKKLLCE